MTDVEYTNQISAPEDTDVFSILPEKLSSPSFFRSHLEDQRLVISFFVDKAKIHETEQIDKLLTSPLLSPTVSIPSLLSRIWITKSIPEKARIIALERFTNHLASSFDFQAFLPHLLVPLSDSSNSIRLAAANELRVLH